MRYPARILLALALALSAPSGAAAPVFRSARAPKIAPATVATRPAGLPPALTPPTPGLGARQTSATLEAAAPPRTALLNLKTELLTPPPDPANSAGVRDHAARSFEAKLGLQTPEAATLAAATADPPPSLDPPTLGKDIDGGGPNYGHRLIKFLGETYRSLLFRPNVPVEQEIIRLLDSTRKGDAVFLALYEFKQTKTLDALRKARARGVDIRILLDYENVFPPAERTDGGYTPTRSAEIWALAREGFNIKALRGRGIYGIMHNKIAVVERGQAESLGVYGSYNWSWTAEDDHYENANFSVNKKRVDFLKQVWSWMDSLSQPVVYNRTNGTIWLQNPDHQWPLDVPPPPQYTDLDVSFNDVLLPSVVASPAPAGLPNVETRLVEAIDASRKKIEVSIFTLRSTLIAEALARAQARGVDVEVIMDKSQASGGQIRLYADYLAFQGVCVRLLSGPDPTDPFQLAQKTHHKFARFDGKLVETGSANYTKNAAVNNFENAHFLGEDEAREDIRGYGQVFAHMWARAEPLAAPTEPPVLPTDAELLSELGRTPQNSEPRLVEAVDAAQKNISISVLALRSTLIAKALSRAKARGVGVRIIIDQEHADTELVAVYADWLAYHKIAVRTLDKYESDGLTPPSDASALERFAVFDDKTLATGLPSYTKSGLMPNYGDFTTDAETARRYGKLFDQLWRRALPVARPGSAPAIPSNEELLQEAIDAPDTAEATPGKLPAWPRPQARTVSFRGKSYPAVVTRPDTPVEPLIVELIRSARKSVRLSLYEFNQESVLEALRWLRDSRPSVKIEILIDRSHVYTTGTDHTGNLRKPSPQIVALVKEGFNPMIPKIGSGIQHSKYLLVDAPETGLRAGLQRLLRTFASNIDLLRQEVESPGIVLRGSYNFTDASENNHYENVVISTEKERMLNYLGNFRHNQSIASPVDPDKLEEVLSRTAPDASHESMAPPLAGDTLHPSSLRTSLLAPTPILAPNGPEMPFDLNGEKFQREYFSPGGKILDAWLRAIGAARTSIQIAMFGFYSRQAADALLAALAKNEQLLEALAGKRKTNPDFVLRLALDAGQSTLAKFDKTPNNPKGTPVNIWFRDRGVDVRISAGPHSNRDQMLEKLHSKYIIVDEKFVMTGSFNLSPPGDVHNSENATVIMDPLDVAVFLWDFERIYLNAWVPGRHTAELPKSPPPPLDEKLLRAL